MPKGIKGFQKEELNPMWVGDDIGYGGLHSWVKSRLPSPINCSRCKKKRRLDLANISQKYIRDITDWEWLCRDCHMSKDGRKNNLIIRNKKVSHKIIMFSEDKSMVKLFSEIASKRKRDKYGKFIREDK